MSSHPDFNTEKPWGLAPATCPRGQDPSDLAHRTGELVHRRVDGVLTCMFRETAMAWDER